MPTRRPPTQSAPPVLTLQQRRAYNGRLKRCIAELQAFDPQTVTKRFGEPVVIALETSIDQALSDLFGNNTPDYGRYRGATKLDNGPVTMRMDPTFSGGRHYDDAPEARRYAAEGKAQALALLNQAARTVDDQIADEESLASPDPAVIDRTDNSKVFIVHGHDQAPREMVARFLEALGLEPIILHEQANMGRTIIQKLVDHGDVGFAVVLLTPDDEGRTSGGQLQPRARQNVILELGYFVGLLGSPRVCALKRGEVEIPSDFHGVVYEPFDDHGGWKQSLARELDAAGYHVDWNVVMRR